MKSQFFNQLAITMVAVATLIGINSYSNSTATSEPAPANSARAVKYATLTLAEEAATNGQLIYVTYFNFGIMEFEGRSRQSREDSYRNVINRLGGNSAEIHIYTLMDAIGRQGWELIETKVENNQITRIFMQPS